jgi:hypothetical protein
VTRDEFRARVLGRRYWFTGGLGSVYPVQLVAMRSAGGESWAAYIAGVPVMQPETDALAMQVATLGAKIDEATARAMFPGEPLPYRA